MAMILSPSSMTVSGRSGVAIPSRMTANSEQPSGIYMSLGARPIAGEPGLEVRLDQLELALAERRQMEQLVDRDVLFDRAQDHPGRADSSSTPRCRKSASFLGLLTRAMVRGTSKWCFAIWQMTRLSSSSPVTAATTSARLQPASARYLPSQPSCAMTIEPISSAICRARDAVLLHERDLVARFDQLLGEVVADLAPADDEHEHVRPPDAWPAGPA